MRDFGFGGPLLPCAAAGSGAHGEYRVSWPRRAAPLTVAGGAHWSGSSPCAFCVAHGEGEDEGRRVLILYRAFPSWRTVKSLFAVCPMFSTRRSLWHTDF